MKHTNKQRGGMILGIIVGVLVGLGVALGVAIYVMKVPTPFNNKGTSRSAAQDLQEAKKNKDWDPNAALSGKPATKADAAAQTKPAEAKPVPAQPPAAPTPTAQQAISVTTTVPAASPAPAKAAPAVANTPAVAPTASGSAEVEYFVQVAAFSNEAEAQAMRGKLALAGFEGKIVERDQSGRTVYRVRTGPFSQAAGEKTKANLEAAGFDTVLVRSQR